MSLILKGIDLPTNGETLIVGIYGDGNVSIEHSKPLVLAIEPNAKAIQLPKRHGDIKDVGKLESHEEFDGYGFTKSVYVDDIHNAPTILEAEEEDVHKSNV